MEKKNISDVLLSMFVAKPWLFQKTTPNMQFNDYILQLNQKTNTAFFRYMCPQLYLADVLDEYKDFLIYTAPFENKGSIGYLSVFGINPNTIFTTNLGTMDEKMITSIDVHTNSPLQYFKFLADIQKFIFVPKVTAND